MAAAEGITAMARPGGVAGITMQPCRGVPHMPPDVHTSAAAPASQGDEDERYAIHGREPSEFVCVSEQISHFSITMVGQWPPAR